jgi:hypothetical protein
VVKKLQAGKRAAVGTPQMDLYWSDMMVSSDIERRDLTGLVHSFGPLRSGTPADQTRKLFLVSSLSRSA